MQRLKKTPLAQRLGQLLSTLGAVTMLPLYVAAAILVVILASVVL